MTTPIGFRWQAVNRTNPARGLKVAWTARGIRAAPEQIADLGKYQPKFLDVVQDTGKFHYAEGEQGQVSFTRPFAFPPNIDVPNVIVSEITATGFRWQHPGPKRAGTMQLVWTARGVPEIAVWKKADKK
jgi:hypothetical protein